MIILSQTEIDKGRGKRVMGTRGGLDVKGGRGGGGREGVEQKGGGAERNR